MLMYKSLKIATLVAVVGSAVSFSSLACAAMAIKVAFNQSDKHPQYRVLEELGQKLNEETDGRYKLTIYPNELMGDQRATLELVQNGAIQMAVVANPIVENYDKTFRMIGMPYVYTSPEHQEKVFTSGVLNDLFASTQRYGFEVLTAYTAGARSMYTKDAPTETIADMKGKKIRVMQSDTMIKMLTCMGGTGVPMSQGEVYTAVQQGVLDGAENNEITYADLKHYEVAPYFTATRHLMVPDLVVISSNFINSISKKDQATLRRLAKESTLNEFKLWNEQIEQAKVLAVSQGATFTEVDVKPFQKNCKKLHSDLAETDAQKTLLEEITALQ
ncbi:TRAP transporter substrate-binding protein [Vibrio mimicus]|uniref:TRAP transporter substrate-binding protein n=1 Tax=Vibrio mimicus TaxID=674 RepID=UPI002FF3F583